MDTIRMSKVGLTNAQLRAAPLFPVDAVTEAIQVITTDHSQIHESHGFSVYVTFANVANAGTRHVILTTPADKYVHLKFYDLWCNNAQAQLQIYEDPYAVAGGNAPDAGESAADRHTGRQQHDGRTHGHADPG